MEEALALLERREGMIFDLDGTLLDSMGIWKEIDLAFLARRGIAAPEDYPLEMAQRSFTEGADYTIRRFALFETPEAVMEEWHQMAKRAYAGTISLKPGAREFLLRQRKRGARLGVATALHPEYYLPVLERNGILDWFSAFAVVQEVPRGKGFPDVYLLAAERLGLDPEKCAVLEDIYSGICGAKAGGFFTCGVADDCSAADWGSICREADCVITGFESVLRGTS